MVFLDNSTNREFNRKQIIFSNWFGPNGILFGSKPKQKILNTIWFRFDLIRFWKDFSVWRNRGPNVRPSLGTIIATLPWCARGFRACCHWLGTRVWLCQDTEIPRTAVQIVVVVFPEEFPVESIKSSARDYIQSIK